MSKKSPPPLFTKEGGPLPFIKGGKEGLYKLNVVSNMRPLINPRKKGIEGSG